MGPIVTGEKPVKEILSYLTLKPAFEKKQLKVKPDDRSYDLGTALVHLTLEPAFLRKMKNETR